MYNILKSWACSSIIFPLYCTQRKIIALNNNIKKKKNLKSIAQVSTLRNQKKKIETKVKKRKIINIKGGITNKMEKVEKFNKIKSFFQED